MPPLTLRRLPRAAAAVLRLAFLLWAARPGRCLAGPQSVLAPASEQAAGIALLSWVMFGGAAVIFVIVMALVGAGVLRGRRRGNSMSDGAAWRFVLIAGVAVPAVVLLALVSGSVLVDRASSSALAGEPVLIEVTGKRWWWKVRYLDEDMEAIAITANEIHVPVDRPVKFLLAATDVIHSFWVPNMQGKTDLIPGRVNVMWFRADRPGVYRGQCAEFCGLQHAHMGLILVASAPDEYERWLEAQRQPAAAVGAAAQRGQAAFLHAGCGACHTVRGTPARGEIGPDLTHLASRATLAAATIPNTRGHLGGWIVDPQSIKPGVLMPPSRLAPYALQAILDYLGSLH